MVICQIGIIYMMQEKEVSEKQKHLNCSMFSAQEQSKIYTYSARLGAKQEADQCISQQMNYYGLHRRYLNWLAGELA